MAQEEREPTEQEIVEYISSEFSEVGVAAVIWALRVVGCESQFKIAAKNDSGATGLWQFMPSTFSANGGKKIEDWKEQTQIAKRMYSIGNLSAWECNPR